MKCRFSALLFLAVWGCAAPALAQEETWGQAGARVGFGLGALAPQVIYSVVAGESSVETGGSAYMTWFMVSLGAGALTGALTSLWWSAAEAEQGWLPADGAQVAGAFDGVLMGGMVGLTLMMIERRKPASERSGLVMWGAPITGALLGGLALGQFHRSAQGDRLFHPVSAGSLLGAMGGLLGGAGLFLLTDQKVPELLVLGLPVGMVAGALLGRALGSPEAPVIPVMVGWSF